MVTKKGDMGLGFRVKGLGFRGYKDHLGFRASGPPSPEPLPPLNR